MGKLEQIKSKIYNHENIVKQCMVWRFQDKKIVFTNGCFDLLHLGHAEYLMKAKDLGGVLVIGLNSDASVRRLKGHHRPINNQHSRAILLASMIFVDAIVFFDEDTPYELINLIKPDVLVKGNDYIMEEIVGHDIVMANGGEVVTVELTKGYSTSRIEEHILRAHRH